MRVCPPPLEDSFGGVTLLLPLGFVLFLDLVSDPNPGAQLRPTCRFLPPVARRNRIPQHLANGFTRHAELPRRLRLAHLIDHYGWPNARLLLHYGVPQHNAMEMFDGTSFAAV